MEKLKRLLIENTGPQWAEAILFAAGGVIAGIIFGTILNKIIKRCTKKTKTLIDDIIAEHTRLPMSLLFILTGLSLGLDKLTFSSEGDYLKGKIFFALFVCLISWIIMKILDAILPAAIIAKSFGHDITAILAGLGIGGAALALAARDILASFFGSVAVLADKPFHVGDRVRFIDKNYEAIDGFITEIRFRTTRLTTLDNRTVIIPNTIFAAIPVQNVSAEPHTRVLQTISIRSSNGYEKTKTAVDILRNLSPPSAKFGAAHFVSLVSVGIAVYKITFIFFIEKDADYFETINAVNLEIVHQFEKAGIVL